MSLTSTQDIIRVKQEENFSLPPTATNAPASFPFPSSFPSLSAPSHCSASPAEVGGISSNFDFPQHCHLCGVGDSPILDCPQSITIEVPDDDLNYELTVHIVCLTRYGGQLGPNQWDGGRLLLFDSTLRSCDMHRAQHSCTRCRRIGSAVECRRCRRVFHSACATMALGAIGVHQVNVFAEDGFACDQCYTKTNEATMQRFASIYQAQPSAQVTFSLPSSSIPSSSPPSESSPAVAVLPPLPPPQSSSLSSSPPSVSIATQLASSSLPSAACAPDLSSPSETSSSADLESVPPVAATAESSLNESAVIGPIEVPASTDISVQSAPDQVSGNDVDVTPETQQSKPADHATSMISEEGDVEMLDDFASTSLPPSSELAPNQLNESLPNRSSVPPSLPAIPPAMSAPSQTPRPSHPSLTPIATESPLHLHRRSSPTRTARPSLPTRGPPSPRRRSPSPRRRPVSPPPSSSRYSYRRSSRSRSRSRSRERHPSSHHRRSRSPPYDRRFVRRSRSRSPPSSYPRPVRRPRSLSPFSQRSYYRPRSRSRSPPDRRSPVGNHRSNRARSRSRSPVGSSRLERDPTPPIPITSAPAFSPVQSVSASVCFSWRIRKSCARHEKGQCSFDHPHDYNFKSNICFSVLDGKPCYRGSICRFSHEKPIQQPAPINTAPSATESSFSTNSASATSSSSSSSSSSSNHHPKSLSSSSASSSSLTSSSSPSTSSPRAITLTAKKMIVRKELSPPSVSQPSSSSPALVLPPSSSSSTLLASPDEPILVLPSSSNASSSPRTIILPKRHHTEISTDLSNGTPADTVVSAESGNSTHFKVVKKAKLGANSQANTNFSTTESNLSTMASSTPSGDSTHPPPPLPSPFSPIKFRTSKGVVVSKVTKATTTSPASIKQVPASPLNNKSSPSPSKSSPSRRIDTSNGDSAASTTVSTSTSQPMPTSSMAPSTSMASSTAATIPVEEVAPSPPRPPSSSPHTAIEYDLIGLLQTALGKARLTFPYLGQRVCEVASVHPWSSLWPMESLKQFVARFAKEGYFFVEKKEGAKELCVRKGKPLQLQHDSTRSSSSLYIDPFAHPHLPFGVNHLETPGLIACNLCKCTFRCGFLDGHLLGARHRSIFMSGLNQTLHDNVHRLFNSLPHEWINANRVDVEWSQIDRLSFLQRSGFDILQYLQSLPDLFQCRLIRNQWLVRRRR